MAKWIEFIKKTRPIGFKTDLYHVRNRETRTEIGVIKWYGPFRKYSFFPEMNMVFEVTCLQDIAAFLDGLMEGRKQMKELEVKTGEKF